MTGIVIAVVSLPIVLAILEVSKAVMALSATVSHSVIALLSTGNSEALTVRVEGADEVARLVAKSGALLLAVKSEDTSTLSDEIVEAAAELDVEFEAWRQQ